MRPRRHQRRRRGAGRTGMHVRFGAFPDLWSRSVKVRFEAAVTRTISVRDGAQQTPAPFIRSRIVNAQVAPFARSSLARWRRSFKPARAGSSRSPPPGPLRPTAQRPLATARDRLDRRHGRRRHQIPRPENRGADRPALQRPERPWCAAYWRRFIAVLFRGAAQNVSIWAGKAGLKEERM